MHVPYAPTILTKDTIGEDKGKQIGAFSGLIFFLTHFLLS